MGEDQESEKLRAKIDWLGPVGGESPDYKIWQEDGISAKPAVIAERFETTEEEAPAIMEQLRELVEDSYRLAHTGSAVRCIDGRGEDEAVEELPKDEPIGPQVPGGTPVMALCYMLATGERGKNIEEDLAKYEALIADLPFPPGAHTDRKNHGSEDKTGCGAIDKMLRILELMCNRREMFGYIKAVVGESISDEDLMATIDLIVMRSEELLTHYRDSYFMKDEKKGVLNYGKRLISKIKETGQRRKVKAVEDLAGEHKEVLLMINMVEGTTFDRDAFAAATGGRAQAFNYDLWHVVNRAEAVFKDNEEAKRTMTIANAMYAVATAMALTDGSLELGIRR